MWCEVILLIQFSGRYQTLLELATNNLLKPEAYISSLLKNYGPDVSKDENAPNHYQSTAPLHQENNGWSREELLKMSQEEGANGDYRDYEPEEGEEELEEGEEGKEDDDE